MMVSAATVAANNNGNGRFACKADLMFKKLQERHQAVAIPAPFSGSPTWETYPAPPNIAENAAHWKKEGTPGALAKADGIAAAAVDVNCR